MALRPFVDQDVPGPRRDYIGYGRDVPKVRWPDDARIAVNLVLSYGPSVHTRELLVEEGGFVCDADACNDDLPYFTEVLGRRHLVVPYSFTYNDARFVLPQGYGSPDDFATTLKRAFDVYWEEGEERPRMMSIGLHPRLVGQAARIAGLRDFLEYALDKGDVWFARRIDIANWWLTHHEEFEA